MTVEQQLTIYRGTTRWLNYYSPSKFGHIFFVHPFKVQKSKSQKQSSHNSTVFENRPKSRIQHCERSELRVHFDDFLDNWSFLSKSVTKYVTFKRSKLVKNAKIETFKCDILGDF